MKRNIITVLILVALGVGIFLSGKYIDKSPTIYETKTETQEVEVDALEKKIQEAIVASSTETEVFAQRAYEDAKHQAEVEIELEVRMKDASEKDAVLKALQKESISYWRESANVKRLIRETFPDDLRMVEVARLESGFVHYKENGQVLKGKITPADIGLMQVNCDYWCDDAKRLGLDLYNIVENVQMARHIYDTEGITSWVAFNQHLTLK